MATKHRNGDDSKQKKQWPPALLVSDWYVVSLPPVQPEVGWEKYFGLEPEKAAA